MRADSLVALVQCASGSDVDAETLSAWCRRALAGYKCPREFRFVTVIPRNAMGKIDKRALAKQTLESFLRSTDRELRVRGALALVELNVAAGVLVENAEGAAGRAGIRRGDVILAVGNQEIKSVDDLNRLLAPGDRPRTVALLVKRGEGSLYVPLRINGS